MGNINNGILILSIEDSGNEKELIIRNGNAFFKDTLTGCKGISVDCKLERLFPEDGTWLEKKIRQKLHREDFEFDCYLKGLKQYFRISGYQPAAGNIVLLFAPFTLPNMTESTEELMFEEAPRPLKLKEKEEKSITGANSENIEAFMPAQHHRIEHTDREATSLLQELKDTQEKAKESECLISSLLNNMSHEIRTPLNGIIGFAQLLKYKVQSEDFPDEYFDIIINNGNRLLNVINNILYCIRLETNQVPISPSEHSLNEILDEIYWEFYNSNEHSQNSEIELRKFYALPRGEDLLIIDKYNLHEILKRLLDNAFKNTTKGWIELSYEIKNKALTFYVKDTGEGISKDQQDEIFDISQQLQQKIHGEPEGIGLGLNIAQKLVNLMGGELAFDSEKGKGSCFYFSLPFESP